jgi:hypothetical protein
LPIGAAGLQLLLEIKIGRLHRVLVDSGASLSATEPGVGSSEISTTQTAARGITGTKLKTIGAQEITYKVGRKRFTHEFLIAPLDMEYSGILGADVLRHLEARVDLRTSTLVLSRTC